MVATATDHKCQHRNSQANVHTCLPNACTHMLCFRNCIIHVQFLCQHALLFLWRSIQLHDTCKQFVLPTNDMNTAKHISMQTHIHTSLLLFLSLSLSTYMYLHTFTCQKAERVPLQTVPDDSTYTQVYCSMATKTRSIHSLGHRFRVAPSCFWPCMQCHHAMRTNI